MNEERIIEELKHGNLSALEDLYEIYSIPALKTAYLIVADKFMAEDILQETFIKCYKSINQLKDNNAFKPWFYKILTRIAYREIKKSKKLQPVENIFENITSSHTDKYFANYTDSLIYQYIERLSIKQKTTIILYYYNDMSVKEIAKVMNCYEGTVKSRLNSARKQLKKQFEMEGFINEI